MDSTLRIDCDDCVMLGTHVCADCVVTYLCTRDREGAVVIDVADVRALKALQRNGLAPGLRMQPRRRGGG